MGASSVVRAEGTFITMEYEELLAVPKRALGADGQSSTRRSETASHKCRGFIQDQAIHITEKGMTMKVKEAMTANPVCCVPSDTAQQVAKVMCDQNVGSIPVVKDQQTRELAGIITDRDLCCTVVAQGLDPKSTQIQQYMRQSPVSCREDEDLSNCEKSMQSHQIRRIPVVDNKGCCIGIVSQADLALKDKPDRVSKTVAEISRRHTAAA